MSHSTLIDLWYVLTGFIFFLHLGLGGIDLGACVLSLFLNDKESEQVLSSIDGVWHANQTWLVALGAVLFGAFPGAYATILPRVYGLVMFLLAALTVRGLGLEYRHEARDVRIWRIMAGCGAAATLLCEVLILANLLTPVLHHSADLSLLRIFGTTLVPLLLFLLGSVLLCSGAWLIRSMPAWPNPSLRLQTVALWATVTGAASTPLLAAALCHKVNAPIIMTRPFLLPLATAGAVTSIILLASLRSRWQGSPLPWALTLAGICLAACAVCLYPVVQDRDILSSLAAAPEALLFLSGAATLLLPTLLTFQIYQYRIHLRHGRQALSATSSHLMGQE